MIINRDFIRENEARIDSNQVCYYPGYVSARWLSVRLEIIGNLVLMFAALLAVLSRGAINPGNVGLSLSYALNVTGVLNMLVRQSSEVETNMVAVERIREYQEILQEAPFEVPRLPSYLIFYPVKFSNKYLLNYVLELHIILENYHYYSFYPYKSDTLHNKINLHC